MIARVFVSLLQILECATCVCQPSGSVIEVPGNINDRTRLPRFVVQMSDSTCPSTPAKGSRVTAQTCPTVCSSGARISPAIQSLSVYQSMIPTIHHWHMTALEHCMCPSCVLMPFLIPQTPFGKDIITSTPSSPTFLSNSLILHHLELPNHLLPTVLLLIPSAMLLTTD